MRRLFVLAALLLFASPVAGLTFGELYHKMFFPDYWEEFVGPFDDEVRTRAGGDLYRSGNEVGAAKKLRQAMLSNLYLLPHLLGSPIDELDIWHGSSDAEPSYVECIPEEYFQLWTAAEQEWASRPYHSPGFQSARARYVEISRLLDTTPPGPERSRLVEELYELER